MLTLSLSLNICQQVVASMDWPEATKYRGLVSAQHHRVEIIQDLYNCYEDPKKGTVHGGMIRSVARLLGYGCLFLSSSNHSFGHYRELLRAFWSSTRLKPGRIIFYRCSCAPFLQIQLYRVKI